MIGAPLYIIGGIIGCICLWISKYENPPRVFTLQKLDDPESFRKDFNTYGDPFGLIQNNPGGVSGNGLRYTAEYFILGCRRGIFQHEGASFRHITGSCLVLPGLYRRSPTAALEGTRIDDLVSIASAAQLLDKTIAEDILRFGRKSYWLYNPPVQKSPLVNLIKQFNFKAWLGRYPGMIAHIEYCAGECPSVFKRLVWLLGVAWCGFNAKMNQDEWVLSQRLIEAYESTPYRTYFQDKIVKYWRKQFYKNWGEDGMKKLLTVYFGHLHPLAKYALEP